MKNIHYFIINPTKTKWIIDYNNGEARYNGRTADSLEATNNIEYIDSGDHCVIEFLNCTGYIVHEDISTEEYIKFTQTNI